MWGRLSNQELILRNLGLSSKKKNLVLFTVYRSEYLVKPHDPDDLLAEYSWVKLRCKNFGYPRVNNNLSGERPVQR